VAYSQGFTLYPPQSFDSLGQGTILGVPNPVVVMIGLAIALTALPPVHPAGPSHLRRRRNEDACRLLGIRVRRVKMFTYALAGLLGSVGGILLMSFLGSANPSQGLGDELNVIAAAVIGGQSVRRPGHPLRNAAGATLVGEISGPALTSGPGAGLYWIRDESWGAF